MTRWDEAFEKPAPRTGAQAGMAPVIQLNGQAHAYATAALQSEAVEVATAREGTRNATLNKAAIRMGRHIGAGTITLEQVRDTLADAARQSGLDDTEIDGVLRTKANGGLMRGQDNPRHPTELETPPVTILDLTTEETHDFWTARPLLTHLHTFARARRVSPWAVLGVTLARIVTATAFDVALPPIVGSKASLNLFVALVGASGSGKGAAEGVAADALSVGWIDVHTTGSGEGIAHGFVRRVKNEIEWHNDSHAVLFSVSEIDTLAAQGDRKGATLLPELRRGWSGERLGFGYADPSKRLPVEPHKYRMCLVAGVQPGRSASLLDDSDGGTPQRFLWLPADDREAPDVAPECPKPLTWDMPSLRELSTFGGRFLNVCQEARDTITGARLARLRGEGEALDGHALLTRLKAAAAFALMDRRLEVNPEDWALAGVVMTKSDATREACRQTLAVKAKQSNTAKALAEGERAVTVDEQVADAAIKRVCGLVVRKLRREDDWTPRSVLTRAAGRDVQYLEDALDRLTEAGQIDVDHVGRGTKYKASEVKA